MPDRGTGHPEQSGQSAPMKVTSTMAKTYETSDGKTFTDPLAAYGHEKDLNATLAAERDAATAKAAERGGPIRVTCKMGDKGGLVIQTSNTRFPFASPYLPTLAAVLDDLDSVVAFAIENFDRFSFKANQDKAATLAILKAHAAKLAAK